LSAVGWKKNQGGKKKEDVWGNAMVFFGGSRNLQQQKRKEGEVNDPFSPKGEQGSKARCMWEPITRRTKSMLSKGKVSRTGRDVLQSEKQKEKRGQDRDGKRTNDGGFAEGDKAFSGSTLRIRDNIA